jgi:KAP family P-loop domain
MLLNDQPVAVRVNARGTRDDDSSGKRWPRKSRHNRRQGESALAGEGQGEDFLQMQEIAQNITDVLDSSSGKAPFVLAIDGRWGMGKSTLMRQMEASLANRDKYPLIKTVWFNAWTAQGDDALEGLIKSVLDEVDRNLVRRWTRRLARRRRLLGVAGIGFTVVGRFFGVARLVDELWRQLALDATSRNKLQESIHGMLDDWVKQDSNLAKGRCMVVFVDDLDRCTDDVIVKVCEAIKLYLDAPGLIFVLGCDQSVLARGVAASARGGTDEGRSYLEKIVQVVYRLPDPSKDQITRLIDGYAKTSETSSIVDEPVREILVANAGSNPRRIKRLINSFILEFSLADWSEPALGGRRLIIAILLQSLYPSFYEFLIGRGEDADPVQEILDYAAVRAISTERPSSAHLRTIEMLFRNRNLPVPSNLTDLSMEQVLEQLDRGVPEFFPGIVSDNAFLNLLHELGDERDRRAFLDRLSNHGLATEATAPESALASESQGNGALAGLRVLCLFQNQRSGKDLVALLQGRVASAEQEPNVRRAAEHVRRTGADAVVIQADDLGDLEFAVKALRSISPPILVVILYPGITPNLRENLENPPLTLVVDSLAAVPGALERAESARAARAT